MNAVQLPPPSLMGKRKKLDTDDGADFNSGSGMTHVLPSEAPSLTFGRDYSLDGPRLRKFQQSEPVVVAGNENVPKSEVSRGKELLKDSMPQDTTVSVKDSFDVSNQLDDVPTMAALPNPPLLDKAAVFHDLRKTNNNSGLDTAIFSTVWEGMKKMMGFSPDCLNGGHKNLRGNCICPKYYEGSLCESIVCANNGTRKRSHFSFPEEICVCPFPDFIGGKHCEVVRCHNGGKDLGNGHCSCVDGWYTGQFCQFYTSSWLVAVGLPLLGIAMVIICCVVCRLDLCPRRSSRRERRPRRRHQQHPLQQPRSGNQRCLSSRQNHRSVQSNNQPSIHNADPNLLDQTLIIQENILNEGVIRQLNGRQYVVRLEEVPNFNPQLLLTMEQNVPSSAFKPVDPPPPYDQAVRCASVNPRPPLPPNYSPPQAAHMMDRAFIGQENDDSNLQQRPPLPRFRPPDPP